MPGFPLLGLLARFLLGLGAFLARGFRRGLTLVGHFLEALLLGGRVEPQFVHQVVVELAVVFHIRQVLGRLSIQPLFLVQPLRRLQRGQRLLQFLHVADRLRHLLQFPLRKLQRFPQRLGGLLGIDTVELRHLQLLHGSLQRRGKILRADLVLRKLVQVFEPLPQALLKL